MFGSIGKTIGNVVGSDPFKYAATAAATYFGGPSAGATTYSTLDGAQGEEGSGFNFGDVIPGVLSYLGGEKTNEAQIAAAREQMRFQERMSSTAYQRAMADMRKAGLNPILAGKLGGASTPGGAMPVLHDAIGKGVGSALQAKAVSTQAKQVESNVEKIAQEINNLKAAEDLTKTQRVKVSVEVNQIQQQVRKLMQEVKGLTYENALKQILNDWYADGSETGRAALISKDMGLTPSELVKVVKEFFGKKRR